MKYILINYMPAGEQYCQAGSYWMWYWRIDK